MSILDKIKLIFKLGNIVSSIKEGKVDFKSVVGWIKVLGYIGAIGGLLGGFLDAKTTLIITAVLSAIVKGLEIYVKTTVDTADDKALEDSKDSLKKGGLLN